MYLCVVCTSCCLDWRWVMWLTLANGVSISIHKVSSNLVNAYAFGFAVLVAAFVSCGNPSSAWSPWRCGMKSGPESLPISTHLSIRRTSPSELSSVSESRWDQQGAASQPTELWKITKYECYTRWVLCGLLCYSRYLMPERTRRRFGEQGDLYSRDYWVKLNLYNPLLRKLGQLMKWPHCLSNNVVFT